MSVWVYTLYERGFFFVMSTIISWERFHFQNIVRIHSSSFCEEPGLHKFIIPRYLPSRNHVPCPPETEVASPSLQPSIHQSTRPSVPFLYARRRRIRKKRRAEEEFTSRIEGWCLDSFGQYCVHAIIAGEKTWNLDVLRGWLQLSCGFWVYFVASSSRILLSSWT